MRRHIFFIGLATLTCLASTQIILIANAEDAGAFTPSFIYRNVLQCVITGVLLGVLQALAIRQLHRSIPRLMGRIKGGRNVTQGFAQFWLMIIIGILSILGFGASLVVADALLKKVILPLTA